MHFCGRLTFQNVIINLEDLPREMPCSVVNYIDYSWSWWIRLYIDVRWCHCFECFLVMPLFLLQTELPLIPKSYQWRTCILSIFYLVMAVEGFPVLGSSLRSSLSFSKSAARLLTVAKKGAQSPKVDTMSAWMIYNRWLRGSQFCPFSSEYAWSLCYLQKYVACCLGIRFKCIQYTLRS